MLYCINVGSTGLRFSRSSILASCFGLNTFNYSQAEVDRMLEEQVRDMSEVAELRKMRGGHMEVTRSTIVRINRKVYQRQLQMYRLIELDNKRRDK